MHSGPYMQQSQATCYLHIALHLLSLHYQGRCQSPAYLPLLQLGGDFELLEASLEVELECFRLGEVWPVTLVAILVQVRQVVAQNLAKASELCVSLVLEAELECPMCSHLCSRRKKQRACIQQNRGEDTPCYHPDLATEKAARLGPSANYEPLDFQNSID